MTRQFASLPVLPVDIVTASQLAALGGVFCLVAPCFACPLCDSGTGEQVRAGILSPDFGSTLLATIAPFVVLLFIVAALHFGLFAKSSDNVRRRESI